MTTVDHWQGVQQLTLGFSAWVICNSWKFASKLKSALSAKFDRSQRCRKEEYLGWNFLMTKNGETTQETSKHYKMEFYNTDIFPNPLEYASEHSQSWLLSVLLPSANEVAGRLCFYTYLWFC